jgi:hypothetical protein
VAWSGAIMIGRPWAHPQPSFRPSIFTPSLTPNLKHCISVYKIGPNNAVTGAYCKPSIPGRLFVRYRSPASIICIVRVLTALRRLHHRDSSICTLNLCYRPPTTLSPQTLNPKTLTRPLSSCRPLHKQHRPLLTSDPLSMRPWLTTPKLLELTSLKLPLPPHSNSQILRKRSSSYSTSERNPSRNIEMRIRNS